MTLSLAPFVARLEDAGVPRLILGVDAAEPPPADAAVEGGGRVAGFVHVRNGLTRPLEVSGFCLIDVLQHGPSSCGQYTPVVTEGCYREVGGDSPVVCRFLTHSDVHVSHQATRIRLTLTRLH
jgi:hypothetical protein